MSDSISRLIEASQKAASQTTTSLPLEGSKSKSSVTFQELLEGDKKASHSSKFSPYSPFAVSTKSGEAGPEKDEIVDLLLGELKREDVSHTACFAILREMKKKDQTPFDVELWALRKKVPRFSCPEFWQEAEKRVLKGLKGEEKDKDKDKDKDKKKDKLKEKQDSSGESWLWGKKEKESPSPKSTSPEKSESESESDAVITKDEALTLVLYTNNLFCGVLQDALKAEGPSKDRFEEMKNCCQSLTNFYSGYYKLPTWTGTAYRGLQMSEKELSQFKVGQVVRFPGFVSCSQDSNIATGFAAKELKNKEAKRVLMTVLSKSGRNLAPFSFYPEEKEVVFRGNTHFQVAARTKMQVTVEGANHEIEFVSLHEEHDDLFSRKLLLWVDDNPKEGERLAYLIQRKEKVSFVFKDSTSRAYNFLLSHWDSILSSPLSAAVEAAEMKKKKQKKGGKEAEEAEKEDEEEGQEGDKEWRKKKFQRRPLRIVTDMTRMEDGKVNLEAGLDLVCLLLTEFHFRHRITVFTGPKSLDATKAKFSRFPNVFAISKTQECTAYADFSFSEWDDPVLSQAELKEIQQLTEVKERSRKLLRAIRHQNELSAKLEHLPVAELTGFEQVGGKIEALKEEFHKQLVLEKSEIAQQGPFALRLLLSYEDKVTGIESPHPCPSPLMERLAGSQWRCSISKPPSQFQIRLCFEVLHSPSAAEKKEGYAAQVDAQVGEQVASMSFDSDCWSKAICTTKGDKINLPDNLSTLKDEELSHSCTLKFWYGRLRRGGVRVSTAQERKQEKLESLAAPSLASVKQLREGALVPLVAGKQVGDDLFLVPGIERGKDPATTMHLSIFLQ